MPMTLRPDYNAYVQVQQQNAANPGLGYRFYPHFHAYTEDLARRLLVSHHKRQAGVLNLEETDTDYRKSFILVTNKRGGSAVIWKRIAMVPVELEDGQYAVVFYGSNSLSVEIDIAGTISTYELNDDFLETYKPGTELTLLNESPAGIIIFNTELYFSPPPILPLVPRTLPANQKCKLADWKPLPELYATIFSPTNYNPSELVFSPYPVDDLYFEPTGPGSAYSVYNWELFYHIPLSVAIHLSKNQRFDEAKKWFQYVFNPEDDSDGPAPERFWKVRPLQTSDIKSIEEILINLSQKKGDFQNTIQCIQRWMEKPFRPHLVARYRPTAYMYKAVMAYLDNLIAWGDNLFAQDRPESVDDAADRYVEAMGILGYRPMPVPRKGTVGPSTYAKLKQYAKTRGEEYDAFGNILVELESDIPFAGVTPGGDADPAGNQSLAGIGRETLYFCIPRNDKLLSYWDTVADRLFKIHNSLNIMGVFRELPLFEPPIDPGLLAKGVAAGLDVSAIAEGLNQPLPSVRFQFLLQKASEICQEAKSLGDKLLSVIEKEDNEALSILRAKHERTILEMTEMVKYAQWQEAVKSLEGLEKSYENALQRYVYYMKLLGENENDIKTPSIAELESPKDGLEKLKFKSSEPSVTQPDVNIDIAEDAGGETGGKIKTLSSYEVEELKKLADAQTTQDVAAALDAIAGIVRIIPEIYADVKPIGIGAGLQIGGAAIAGVLQIASGISRAVGARYSYEAGRAAKLGGYARREQEWAFQRNAAAGEVNQMIKQYVSAQIREAIAEKELANHRKQIEHSRQIEDFLTNERNGKKANKEFYAWMKREVKGLYGQCFRFAFDMAQKAERALQHELGTKETFLQPGYLAGKEGLLAGEKLHADLRKMEMAYHLCTPDPPLEADVSLLQVDPLAVLQLRATGRCSFSIPETYFDLSCPGFYFRRIHAVSVSVPCVTGPYTGINCTLTLVKNTIRKNTAITDGYERTEDNDERFEDNYDLETIVISKGQNDGGRLQGDRSARDESQRQPFMGKGVIGTWRLELPGDPSKKDPILFDYDTIQDVILHIQYTARQGGKLFKGKAMENLKTAIEEARMAGAVRLFSIRHEFPVEWSKFKNQPSEEANKKLEIEFEKIHYPFWGKDRLGGVVSIDVFADGLSSIVKVNGSSGNGEIGSLEKKDPSLGGIYSTRLNPLPIEKPVPDQAGIKFTLYFSANTMSDLWIAVTWQG
jgi:hypothetical protein